uniref:Uncharacterized protein n=1 Tax=Pavo cristatus TaxID=9049 RepID=A0A8C9FFD7_PAVCR
MGSLWGVGTPNASPHLWGYYTGMEDDAVPSAAYVTQLYYKISRIDWDYEAEPAQIKGSETPIPMDPHPHGPPPAPQRYHLGSPQPQDPHHHNGVIGMGPQP